MAEKLTTLAKRLRPFINGQVGAIAATGAYMQEGPGIDLVGNKIGLGGDSILLYNSDGTPVEEFAATSAGLIAANAAANSGDIIRLPYANTINLAAALTVTANVTIEGFGVGTSVIQSVGDVGAALITCPASSKLENLSVIYSTANNASDRMAIHLTANGASVRRVYGTCTNAGAGGGFGINMQAASGLSYASYSTGTGSSGTGSGVGIVAQTGAELRSCQAYSLSAAANSAGMWARGARIQQCQMTGLDDGTGGKYGLYVYSSGGAQITQVYGGVAQAATKDLYIADEGATAVLYSLHYDTYTNNGGILTHAGGDREAVNHRHEATTTQPGGTLNLIDSPITVIDNALNNSFPSIVEMSNGNLLVVYRAGVGHSGDKGSIKSKISTDLGATWGVEANVYTDATLDSRDPTLLVAADGRIWLNFFLATAATGAHVADGVRISYSDDNGGTWSAPATINSAFTGNCASSGPMIEYPFGRLAIPLYGLNSGDTFYSSSIIFSDDDGANWINETVIADGERDSRQYAEPNIIYLDFYGLTLAMMRSDTPDAANGNIYASFSHDDGLLWSVPASKFAGTGSPRMCQLKNHMLMVIYRNNADVTEAIYRISRTNGYSWSASAVLNDDSVVQMTYAGAVEYDEGILGVVVGVENVLAGDANILYYNMYTTAEAGQLQSNVATGTAPLVVNSTTLVTNLNADTVDGLHAADITPSLALDDLTDVDTTGVGTGDIIYKSAGDWIDYPLGIGSNIENDGSGIKIGDIAGGDYVSIDLTTGEIGLNGDATVFEDIRVEPVVRQAAGAGVPAFEKYFDDAPGTSKGVYLLSFTDEAVAGNEKEVFFNMQMPHSWKIGSDIHVHVHFVPAATVNSSDIIWGLEYCWKSIGEIFGDTVIIQSSTTLLPDDANITAGKHYLAEFADISPGPTASSLSSILIGRLFRNSSVAGDTYTNKVGLLYIDAHYEVDSLGSTEEYTKTVFLADSDGETLLDSDGVELTE